SMKLLKSFFVILMLIHPAGLLAWDAVESPTEMDTHKMIAEQGVLVLQNDLADNTDPEFTANLQLLYDNLYDLKSGSVWPDFNPDKYTLHQDHFYDPDTGQNFTNGYISDTAESQTRLYVAVAVNKWKDGDYSGAAFDLGTAIHFFADLNEPHHASNHIATAHIEFEKWVETVKYDYAISSSGNTTDSDYYTNTVGNFTYLSDFLTNQSNLSASAAKGLAGSAQMSSSWDDWEYVAEESLENAQKSVALVYYRFLHEVAGDDILGNPDPIGKFHVLFKVADEHEAGTDDYVYFGMEFSDGRTLEFECDVPGNDFSRNLRWGYEFNITDSSYEASDITKVWIRKKDYTLWGDDLKLDYIEVYMRGKNVLSYPIYQWLGKGGWWDSDVTYNIDVDGFM
ncbi:MAG: hypothetical protein GY795_00505, partial [Desulfobacterales bacterium]|nr:hypothetical protein [Desulfobacterales bacterium]